MSLHCSNTVWFILRMEENLPFCSTLIELSLPSFSKVAAAARVIES